MKLLADMLNKGAYDKKEHSRLRAWIDQHIGRRLDLSQPGGEEKFNQSLALYLIVRDLMAELNAVGGGFMNQLEWGSDRRGIPLPIADVMESLFNSTFDHNGKKTVLPFATEADTQGLLTMLFSCWLSGGNPPLFMDFRKVWEPWEIQGLAREARRFLRQRTTCGRRRASSTATTAARPVSIGPAGRATRSRRSCPAFRCRAPSCITSPAAATA